MTSQPHFIREWRKHRGLTQEQLAATIIFGRSYIAQIERGERRYGQRFLKAAAAALGCTPADLISRDPANDDELERFVATLGGGDRERALNVLLAMFKR